MTKLEIVTNLYEKLGFSNVQKLNTVILDLSKSIDEMFLISLKLKQRNKTLARITHRITARFRFIVTSICCEYRLVNNISLLVKNCEVVYQETRTEVQLVMKQKSSRALFRLE